MPYTEQLVVLEAQVVTRVFSLKPPPHPNPSLPQAPPAC